MKISRAVFITTLSVDAFALFTQGWYSARCGVGIHDRTHRRAEICGKKIRVKGDERVVYVGPSAYRSNNEITTSGATLQRLHSSVHHLYGKGIPDVEMGKYGTKPSKRGRGGEVETLGTYLILLYVLPWLLSSSFSTPTGSKHIEHNP